MELNQMDWFNVVHKNVKNETLELESSVTATITDDTNSSIALELPIDMQFNDGHLLSIIVYSILFVVATVGNITVLVAILKFRSKPRLSRINLFILHLVIADLLVTFLLMPLEIGWAITVSWKAGDAVCRILSFFRTFGLYLSGFLIVCISLDRFFAVLMPLALMEANKRGRIMLCLAWAGSVVCSLPQALIFHVERHPNFTWFEQCVTFNSFPSKHAEIAYSAFGFVFMYGFPLCMIIFCYSRILYEIYKINRISKQGDDDNVRRSNLGALGRAKVRTLKLSIVIVATFFLCWTPYNIMSLWYWIDKNSAQKVDQRVQKCLFLFACTNSVFNPLVYGLFHTRTKTLWMRFTGKRRNNFNQNFNGRFSKAQPFKVRVRWTPRECLCGTASSSYNMTSSNNIRLRPLYEINGIPVYYNKVGNGQIVIEKNFQPSNSRSLIKTVQVDVADCSKNDHNNLNCRYNQRQMPDDNEQVFIPSRSRDLLYQRNCNYTNNTSSQKDKNYDADHDISSLKQFNAVNTASVKSSKPTIEKKSCSVVPSTSQMNNQRSTNLHYNPAPTCASKEYLNTSPENYDEAHSHTHETFQR